MTLRNEGAQHRRKKTHIPEPASWWSHLKSRSERSAGLSLFQDGVVAVVATGIGFAVLDREAAWENAVAVIVIGLGAGIVWLSLQFLWRFVWTVPREIESELDAALAKLDERNAVARG